jgi:hypothetical protein
MSITIHSKVSRLRDGRVVTVYGKVAARDGVFVCEFGRGKFLEREPTYF